MADKKKTYTKPEIIHELDLETRAGSVIQSDDLADPFDLEE